MIRMVYKRPLEFSSRNVAFCLCVLQDESEGLEGRVGAGGGKDGMSDAGHAISIFMRNR